MGLFGLTFGALGDSRRENCSIPTERSPKAWFCTERGGSVPSALRKGAVLAGYRYVDLGGSSGDEKVTWLPKVLYSSTFRHHLHLSPPVSSAARSGRSERPAALPEPVAH